MSDLVVDALADARAELEKQIREALSSPVVASQVDFVHTEVVRYQPTLRDEYRIFIKWKK